MPIYPKIYEYVIYPLYHFAKRDRQLEALREIRQLQWRTAEELREIQMKKLDRLLRHAFEKVPYYRNLFLQRGIEKKDMVARFQEIPALNKEDIRHNFEHLQAHPQTKSNRLILNSTSGSTGEKLIFYHDQQSDAYRMAVLLYEKEALGVRMGERTAVLWGSPMEIGRAATMRGALYSWITNSCLLSSYQLSQESLAVYYERLRSFKPVLLTSYPGPLTTFCEYLRSRDLRFPTLRAVITSAETLFPWQRELIEETLKCPVYNRYGSREVGLVAHEFPCKSGLHICSSRVFIEILDDQKRPVPPGAFGEIYVTDLDNYGMPFIRYRMGDMARWSAAKECICGRGWPTLESVAGRTFDVVKAPNGNVIGGTYWTILFRKRPGMKQFQVHQTALSKLKIQYVLEEAFHALPESALEFWQDKIREICGDNMLVKFEEVHEIKQTQSGKTRFVISDLRSQGK